MKTRKLLSIILSLAMVLSLLPMTASVSAEGEQEPVVDFSGVITLIEDTPYLVVNKTTTGIRSLGTLDEYMRSLGLGN